MPTWTSNPPEGVLLEGEDLEAARALAAWAIVDAVGGLEDARGWEMAAAMDALRARRQLLRDLGEYERQNEAGAIISRQTRLVLLSTAYDVIDLADQGACPRLASRAQAMRILAVLD